MSRKCPSKFINILDCWLSKTYTSVKWGNCLSSLVLLSNGIRQGSILGPILFSVYTDDLLQQLHNTSLGCHINYINFNALMYADDLLLLSISLADLQKMINVCASEFKILDMHINVSKSSCIRIGKRYDCKVSNIYVGKHTLPWEKQIRYLGINVLAGKNLHYDFHLTKAKYFGALNSLLGKIGTSSNIQVALSLTAAKCFPILTYGLEAITISKSQLSNMCFVYNAIFVKLFSTFDKLIIEQCQYHTGVLPFQYRLDQMRINFLFSLSDSLSSPANVLFMLLGNHELEILCVKYKIKSDSTHSNRTYRIWTAFGDTIKLKP